MGEARVQVRLINAADESLARRGQLAPEKVRSYETSALADTGAVCTVLPPEVVNLLGLDTPTERGVEYAAGRNESVGVTEAVVIEINRRRTSDEALVLGDEVLIGQTVLEKLDLHVDCANQRVTTNPAHPDQAITKVK
jgi:clan AA aspartic protease